MSASKKLMKELVADGGLLQEMGVTGLEHHAGLINEEFLRKLQGRLGLQAFKEMESNDPIVGAMLYALEMLCRSVNWTIEPYGQDDEGDPTPEDEANAEFIEEVFDDMEHDWPEFISEWMATPVYGFAPFEIVWKRRSGYHRHPSQRSKYTDGRIGIARLAIRHPVTLSRWVFDETGRLVAMEQLWEGTRVTIPMEKLLLFTTLQRKGNPEGMSLLRRAFIPYYRKKHIEEVEGIGIERELNGLPKFMVPPEWFMTTASPDEKALLAYVKQTARRLKVDEQGGLVLPKIMDDQGHDLFTFELVSSGGRRAIDTGPPKEYYSRQMAMSILMDVIMIGHEQVGSFALASSKTSLLGISIGALLDGIAAVFNRDLIPRLMELNGLPPERSPRLKHGDLETPDLEILGTFTTALANAGLKLFPTRTGNLERALLRAANLPDDIADESAARFEEAEAMRAASSEAMLLANEQAAAGGGEEGEGDGPPKPPGAKPKPPIEKYDPSQPRDPAGTATGGQWTDGGASGSSRAKPARGGRPKKAAFGGAKSRKDFDKQVDSLYEQQGVTDWQGDYFGELQMRRYFGNEAAFHINSALRTGGDMDARLTEGLQAVENGFARHAVELPENTLLYRAVSGTFATQLAELPEGASFTDKGYTSTAGTIEATERFGNVRMEIRPRAGMKALIYRDETEVLLPAGTQFTVLGKKQAGGVTVIEVEAR